MVQLRLRLVRLSCVVLFAAVTACGTDQGQRTVDADDDHPIDAQDAPEQGGSEPDPVDVGLDPAALGACEERHEPGGSEDGGDVAPPSARFYWLDGWHRFGHDAGLSVEETDHQVSTLNPVPVVALDLESAETIRGAERPHVIVREIQIGRMEDAQAAGAELYVAGSQGDDEYVYLLVAAVLDDSVAFIGDCEFARSTRPLEAYADSRGETPAETFLGLVDGDIPAEEYSAWEAGPPREDPTDLAVWEALDPDERHLDHGLAPDEVLQEAAGIMFFLDFEAAEVEPGTLLCAASQRARSGCFDLASAGRNLFTVQAFTDVPLQLRAVEEHVDGTMEDLAELAELAPDVLERVSASATTDEPLVVRVTGLDDERLLGGQGAVDLETVPLAEADAAMQSR